MVNVGMFIGGCVSLMAGSMLSSSAGVGGGGINVPIFILLFGFTFEEAVIFSNFTILGNYLSQVIVNSRKHHPILINRPLIYFEIVLILLPCQLGGSNLGALLNIILPAFVLYIIALVVLIVASSLTLRKGLYLWEKERRWQFHCWSCFSILTLP